MSTDKSSLLEAADASSKLSVCHTCTNYYTDDCGYCCKHEGDEFMPADDWENDTVTECKYYEEDSTEELDFVQSKKVVGEMVSTSVIKQIQELCEHELDYYNHGMASLDAYRFAKYILDIIEKNTGDVRKSIKEYSTSGMELYEREDLYKRVIPIPVDELVYRSGDAWSSTECVKVTLENQKEVTMFWNCLYFDNKEAADRVTSRAHADYNDYQGRAVES